MFELFDSRPPSGPNSQPTNPPASRFTPKPTEPHPLKCFCNQTINPAKNPEFLIQCQDPQCRKYYHKSCLKLPPNSPSNAFDCPSCILSKCDPLSQVTQTLIPPFLLTIKRKEFSINQDLFKDIKVNEDIGLEIRSLKLEDQNHLQCWPTSGELFFNDSRELEFKPLQLNSAVKKRKDQKFFTRDVRLGLNSICIKFQKEFSLCKPTETFVVAIYAVKVLSCNELVQKIKQKNQRSLEGCKRQILQNFQGSGLDINILSYPLTCVFDMSLLKTPAKGADCTHINCFSLENFVSVCQKNEQRRWTCPICKIKCYDLIVDTYFEQVLAMLKSKYSLCNIDVSTASVKIYRDTGFELVIAQDNMEEENDEIDDFGPPPLDKLVILDESPEPHRSSIFQPPAWLIQNQETTNPESEDILDTLFQKLYSPSQTSPNSLMQIEAEPAELINATANQQQQQQTLPIESSLLDFSNNANISSQQSNPILDDYLSIEPTSPHDADADTSKPVTLPDQPFKLIDLKNRSSQAQPLNEKGHNNRPLFTFHGSGYSSLNNCSRDLPKPTLSQLFEKNRLVLPPAPVGSQNLMPQSSNASQEKDPPNQNFNSEVAEHSKEQIIPQTPPVQDNNPPPVEKKACPELKASTIKMINKLIQDFDKKFVLPSFKTRHTKKLIEEELSFSGKDSSLQMNKKLLSMMKKHTAYNLKASDLNKLISHSFDNEEQKEALKKFRKSFKKKQSFMNNNCEEQPTGAPVHVSAGFEFDPICID